MAAVPVQVNYEDERKWSISVISLARDPPMAQSTATFDQYLCLLLEWEYELLKFLDIPTDTFSVRSHNLEHAGLRVVSDGSVWADNHGSFGWTLSDGGGTRLAHAMGPASGAKVDSYRAEAYGMLSILCFLRHLAAYTTNHPISWDGIAIGYGQPKSVRDHHHGANFRQSNTI